MRMCDRIALSLIGSVGMSDGVARGSEFQCLRAIVVSHTADRTGDQWVSRIGGIRSPHCTQGRYVTLSVGRDPATDS